MDACGSETEHEGGGNNIELHLANELGLFLHRTIGNHNIYRFKRVNFICDKVFHPYHG